MPVNLIKSKSKDLLLIEGLLKQNNLPYQDIKSDKIDFFLAYKDSLLIGIVGLEVFDNIALLRSMVVKEEYRNKGYGSEICKLIIDYAKNKQIKEIYLLTYTADKYFKKLRFIELLRDELPKEIKQTKQFSQLCPCSAVCMVLKI